MATTYNTMIMGASYGSLLAIKLLLAGHDVKLVGLPAEAELINAEGQRVRMPAKERDGLVEIDSRTLPGKLSAATTDAVDPAVFGVGRAGFYPQYSWWETSRAIATVSRRYSRGSGNLSEHIS